MRFVFLCSVVLVIVFVNLFSCTTPEQNDERVARKYCSSCHVFPEPGLLDKGTWAESVLPQMAFRMGVDTDVAFHNFGGGSTGSHGNPATNAYGG